MSVARRPTAADAEILAVIGDALEIPWRAYLAAYLPADINASLVKTPLAMIKSLYSLDTTNLLDTTFGRIPSLDHAAHDIPQICHATYAVNKHADFLQNGVMARPSFLHLPWLNQLLTQFQRSDSPHPLFTLYRFYRFLDWYEHSGDNSHGFFTQEDAEGLLTVVQDPELPDLFAAIGRTRRQQEDHRWVWADLNYPNPS